eukprot:5110510-Prymnesium_polylepis.1
MSGHCAPVWYYSASHTHTGNVCAPCTGYGCFGHARPQRSFASDEIVCIRPAPHAQQARLARSGAPNRVREGPRAPLLRRRAGSRAACRTRSPHKLRCRQQALPAALPHDVDDRARFARVE